jgi:hypothetical protein
MRVLRNRVVGDFFDLRGLAVDASESERRAIGQQLYENGASGVLFKVAAIPDAECVSVFTSEALPEKAVQADHYRFSWNGVAVTKIYNFREGRDVGLDEVFVFRRAAE